MSYRACMCSFVGLPLSILVTVPEKIVERVGSVVAPLKLRLDCHHLAKPPLALARQQPPQRGVLDSDCIRHLRVRQSRACDFRLQVLVHALTPLCAQCAHLCALTISIIGKNFQNSICFSKNVKTYFQFLHTLVFTVHTYRLYNYLSKRDSTNV
uniref:Uncharacterized protein n=1 Tax=Siphoviridae sp. ct2773 TaxID=2826275 RepID=A0A8S5QSL4_9CAUD|nr:MAG TPA: hypothetical protein [Siphoviridae sp. ct2773]